MALANDKNYVPLDLASFNDKVNVVDYFLAQARGLETQNGDDGGGLDGAVADVDLDDDEQGGKPGAEGSGSGS